MKRQLELRSVSPPWPLRENWTIVSGIQPLQSIFLKRFFEREDEFQKFAAHWCERGLQTLEELLQKSSSQYCVGDQITIADLCLVPQMFNATNVFKVKLDKYTTVAKLYKKLKNENTFQESHPKNVIISDNN